MRSLVSVVISLILIGALGVAVYIAVPNIFGSVVAPLPEQYQGTIRAAAQEFNVDSCLIAAVIRGESNWDPNAGSHAGAKGLMQLLPSTARSIARMKNIAFSTNQILNPEMNIRLGTAYLRYNLDSYGGTLRNVLVAYNAGGGRVRLADKQLPRETQGYIVKISRYYTLYSSLYPSFCTGPEVKGGPAVAEPAEDFADFVPVPGEEEARIELDKFWENWLYETSGTTQ